MSVQRPVSPTEWFYLAGQRVTPPFAVQLVVEGGGGVDVAALRRAVADCPGARLVRHGRRWVDGGRPPPVTVATALDPGRALPGTTCEVVVTAGAVVFRAFHGVMDGRGVLTWAADVFRLLRGEPAVGTAADETDQGVLAKLGAVGRRPRLTPRWPSPVGGGGTARWARRTVDGNHPGLVAKVSATIAAHTGAAAHRFMIPVDLRRHLPDGAAQTGNLTLPVFLDVAGAEQWQPLHERLLQALAERRELTGGAAERMAYRLPVGLVTAGLRAAHGRHLCSAIVSDLGRVDLATFAAPGFAPSTVYSLPAHAPLAPLSIAATEPPGRTELTVAHHGDPDAAEALLDAVERALVPDDTKAWAGNRTARPVPASTVVERFHEQVAKTPDAVALTGPQGTVTYAELDARADVVAAVLTARGVGRGDVVGLLADRTVEAVAGLWGVLKAGAAYLPIDPGYPADRTAYLLADSGAKLCLVNARYAAGVPVDTVILDDLPVDGAPAARPAAQPGDLVYVIYTSGSTGRPKGVQIEHRQLTNYVAWATGYYDVDAGTRFALFTSLAFDLTGTAIFLPLLAGGSLALVPGELDHRTLRTVVADSGATALKLTPAHLDLIGRLGLTSDRIRTVVVGGEQLRGAVAARAHELLGCRIVNEYGPTEATIGCVVHTFDPVRDGDRVPIGLPVANTAIRLLDADRRPVATGELYLLGDQLARGYLGRPDLDRERFVRLADGSRAYRTGDLARITADGVLEYLGRTDDQITVNGYRIEPGEIEAVLEERADRAVVVYRDGALVGYVVGAADPVAIRRHAAERLPGYMVPVIVPVGELPQTVNGKLDVSALPAPGITGATAAIATAATAAGSPGRDDVANAVAAIWARILMIEPDAIGPDSDFHALGGDSLAMIEMLAAVTGEVTGGAGDEEFMRAVIADPTFRSVCAAVQAG